MAVVPCSRVAGTRRAQEGVLAGLSPGPSCVWSPALESSGHHREGPGCGFKFISLTSDEVVGGYLGIFFV